jgi:hypothetical protein
MQFLLSRNSNEDMDKIAKLDQEQSLFFSHYNPETVDFLTGLVR